MNAELLNYMLKELSSHVDRMHTIMVESEADEDALFYHKERCDMIIAQLEKGIAPAIDKHNFKVIGGN